MNARRSTQGVLPPCVSGLFSSIGSTPEAVRTPGIAAWVTRNGPGRPRGPPQSPTGSPSLNGDRLGPMT